MTQTDVLVIGAGLTGLIAALELARRGKRVTVLEREDTVGGRVHTDQVDGFLIDRGFQLINPYYPTVRRYADLPALDLKKFGSGVQVHTDSGLKTLAHPARHPQRIAQTLASGLIDTSDAVALAGFLVAGPAEDTLGAELDRRGAGGVLRSKVLEPFLTGVVADDPDAVDAAHAQFLLRSFALGRPSVPARGAQALPNQLAAKARKAGVDIHLRTEATLDSAPLTAHTIIATAPTDQGEPMRGLTTFWLRADEAPSTSKFVRIDGTGSGPVINTAVMTNVAPSYSPDGSALIEASVLDTAELEDVLEHLSLLWDTDAAAWDLLAVTEVPHSLPVQHPGRRRRMQVDGNVIRTGDHVGGGSQHGAMTAGREAAEAVFAASR